MRPVDGERAKRFLLRLIGPLRGRDPVALVWLALAGSMAASLMGITWMVARWSQHDRIVSLEKELAFYKATRSIDIPELLGEFRTFVGSANATVELEKLRGDHDRTVAELARSKALLAELRSKSRIEERFSLQVGQSHTILNGRVVVGLISVAPTFADVSLAGSPENDWRVGEYRELNFGGTRYRLLLERIPSQDPSQVTFRVDALDPVPAASGEG